MYPLLYDIALRLGLGILIGFLLIIFITILETAFYSQNKKIHLAVIVFFIALIVYALGDIAIDILKI